MPKDQAGQLQKSKRGVTRRTFFGFALGTAASLLAACRQQVAGPAPTSSTTTAMPLVTDTRGPASPTPSQPAPSATPIPPTATATVANSPTSTMAADTPTVEPTAIPPSPTTLPATYTPVPATATVPPPPTATPSPVLDRGALTAHWPATQSSRVITVRHENPWVDGRPNSEVVLEMLDAGLQALADSPDALGVWRTLFDADERVLLKVNCISYGGPTQPAVTYAVAQRLQDAGLAAEKILIFDRNPNELASAGYTLNDGGSGVQCRGTSGDGTEATLSQAKIRFFREIDECDSIINLPTPKQHGFAGISVSLKNHYGSVNNPGALHGNSCDPAIAELNAQPNIRDKTRLVVGAALNVSPGDWNRPSRENAILLSFDPVALDTVARDILIRHRESQGLDAGLLVGGSRHLQTAQSLNVGATDAHLIDLQEVTLG